jgi:hypothetical protein
MIVPVTNIGAYKFTAEYYNPDDEESGFILEARKVTSIEE